MVRIEYIPLPEFPEGFLMETYDRFILEADGNYYHEGDTLNPEIVEQVPDLRSSVAHEGYIYTRWEPNYITRRLDVRREMQEIYQKAVNLIHSVQFDDQPVRFYNQLHQLTKRRFMVDEYEFQLILSPDDDDGLIEIGVGYYDSDYELVGFRTVAKVYDQRG
jgi:hypothetical protein